MNASTRPADRKTPQRQNLSDLLNGTTELDAEAAAKFALGVLNVVQVVCTHLFAAGVIEPECMKASLEGHIDLQRRRGDRVRTMPAAILLDALESAVDHKRATLGRDCGRSGRGDASGAKRRRTP